MFIFVTLQEASNGRSGWWDAGNIKWQGTHYAEKRTGKHQCQMERV